MLDRVLQLASTILVLTSIAACSGVENDDLSSDQELLTASGIVSVRAIGSDGNVPENAIDGSLSTRWSNDGRGSWIIADLGQVRVIDTVKIAWYRGNQRQSLFTLGVSSDGARFTQVFAGRSSGRTTGLESYPFPAISARFVKVTIDGNTKNAWASITELEVPFTTAPAPAPNPGDPGCAAVQAAAVTASDDDGNGPGNAVDGNLATRWSCLGAGCWIQLDLGAERTLSAVNIAWYKGDQRTARFDVALSRDGAQFAPAFTGQSSGTSLSPERYAFPAAAGRFVRVTVNGNSANEWASIAELGASSGGCTAPPPVEPPPPPPADAGPPPPPPPPPADNGGVDPFGVTMIHPSKPGGESWSLAADPTGDSRFDPQDSITKNADGSWKMRSTQVRMNVFTSTGYDSSKIATYDRDVLGAQGYMQAPNDWRNVEMTGFVKLNAGSDMADNFSWYGRGGRHSDSLACEGSSLKGGLHHDGRVRFEKESWHVSYDQGPYSTATSSLRGRWVGFKFVMRNVSATAVKMEVYLNDNGDRTTWIKIAEMTDSGNMGGDMTHCGGSTDAMPITWGGPIVTFRWDSASDVDFKWLSVREIQ